MTSQTTSNPAWRDPEARRYQPESLMPPDFAQDLVRRATAFLAAHPSCRKVRPQASIRRRRDGNDWPPAVINDKRLYLLPGLDP